MGAIGAAQRPRVSPGMPDDLADGLGVQLFSSAMRDRLIEKRAAGRYGWHDPDVVSEQTLEDMLANQFVACDPMDEPAEVGLRDASDETLVDIANYAMMLWNRRRQGRFE